ncbi:MAG: valine--tRNA ligase [Alphaproteobacteria bacterium]|nr:valine--tRNA ligase [Alphaproteobacteria bacterium]
MLDKTYNPADTETRQYERWERAGAFACNRRPGAETYCIVIPPPNVTGSLHMGHALNNTLQDILVRYKRMRGFEVLWQPGTDHAGIATQMVVERQLALEQKDRRGMGRAAFLGRVWKWKAESGGTISRQLRRLGASCDWSRERFTMDEGLSKAVLKVFVDLYRAGLIYKDKRLVNWDTRFESAISDLEVENREIDGHLWHFKYPVEGETGAFITIATTRPETMLADTAVAVHPNDERYRALVGKHVILPLVGRRIPIVADEYADPEQGSGAVKITPAHDFNDFEVGVRHKLPHVNILDSHGVLNENAPAAYRGLDRFEARKKVVADLEALGLVEKIVPHKHVVPHGDRSGTVIEPWLTDQWYVDAKKLAVEAIAMVEQGRTKFVPKTWEKTYFEWMRNIQPWCISRQLWWGHQIPAWYGADGKVFVALTEAEARADARAAYGQDVPLSRDEDVLDTWFSSALWPFSTLGWPDQTPELKRFYPTSVLVTGFDIIFFWVARMMMMGLHFTGDIPFRDVYVHALVRDARGQKMSKSKGNIIDPLELIDKFGADALRFTLAAMAAQGRDVKLAESRVEGYRNFATKLWNAARFCEMNECRPVPGFDPATVTTTLNRWIVGEAAAALAAVAQGIESYRFNEAAAAAYRFTWATFCDWYIEFAKPALTGEDAAAKAETRATAAWALDMILHMLAPMMPFVTEEIFERFFAADGRLLMLDPWPTPDAGWGDAAASAEMDWVVRIVTEVRSVRSEMNVPAGAKVPLSLMGASAETAARLERHRDVIVRLARLERVTLGGDVPKGAAQIVLDEATLVLPLAGIIDIAAERARLEREVKKLAGEIAGIDKKLANPAFVAKAPEEVVEEQRERRVDAEAASRRLMQAVARLA